MHSLLHPVITSFPVTTTPDEIFDVGSLTPVAPHFGDAATTLTENNDHRRHLHRRWRLPLAMREETKKDGVRG